MELRNVGRAMSGAVEAAHSRLRGLKSVAR